MSSPKHEPFLDEGFNHRQMDVGAPYSPIGRLFSKPSDWVALRDIVTLESNAIRISIPSSPDPSVSESCRIARSLTLKLSETKRLSPKKKPSFHLGYGIIRIRVKEHYRDMFTLPVRTVPISVVFSKQSGYENIVRFFFSGGLQDVVTPDLPRIFSNISLPRLPDIPLHSLGHALCSRSIRSLKILLFS